MKILQGKYKFKTLSHLEKSRPLISKIRKSIFDVLHGFKNLEHSTVADICAGSGTFGFEALSRGAINVNFVEKDIRTASSLRHICRNWNIENARVTCKDARYLPLLTTAYDIIFCDPPFLHDWISCMINALLQKNWVGESSILIVRLANDISQYFIKNKMKLLYSNKIGVSYIFFFSKE